MDLSKITNQTIKQAVEALQANDKSAFYSFFTPDAKFSDDGNEKNFKAFFDNAFNHKEKFLALDKIDDEGKILEGDFYAGQWGTFKVYFHFTLNSSGKIERVDIGQVSKRCVDSSNKGSILDRNQCHRHYLKLMKWSSAFTEWGYPMH